MCQAFEAMFVDGNDMVQQVTPTALYPSLCNSILPRALPRGPDGRHGHGPNGDRDLRPILGIAVKDQKPGARFVGERLSQLLNDPGTCGMSGDMEMQNSPAAHG